jgi:hypothetical protein
MRRRRCAAAACTALASSFALPACALVSSIDPYAGARDLDASAGFDRPGEIVESRDATTEAARDAASGDGADGAELGAPTDALAERSADDCGCEAGRRLGSYCLDPPDAPPSCAACLGVGGRSRAKECCSFCCVGTCQP